MNIVSHTSELLSRNARRFANEPAVRDGTRVFTYLQLDQAVTATAEHLVALGVRNGDRVLLVVDNCAEAIVLFFALGRLDAWAVLASGRLAPAEVDGIIAHSEPRLSIHAGTHAASVHGARRSAQPLDLGPVGSWPVERADVDPEAHTAQRSEGVAAIIYTSGTTGAPKGAMLTHANLAFIAMTQAEQRRYAPGDVTYCPLPIAHAGGLASITLGTLAGGGCIRLARRFDPAELVRALRDERVSVVPGVPTLHLRTVEWSRAHGANLRTPWLRMVTSAASPLDARVKSLVEAAYGLPLQNHYGLTETSALVCQTSLDQPLPDVSVGKPLPGVRIRIVGEDRGERSPGEPGELEVTGPNVLRGYFRNEAATRAAFTDDGWYRTGDLARVDADGNVFIAGRAKDLIKRSGYSVHPVQVEAALCAHPSIALATVVGRPHGADEEVVAFVQLAHGVDALPANLRSFLAQQLAVYERPGLIRVLTMLPTLHNGKIDKPALRRLALELPRDSG